MGFTRDFIHATPNRAKEIVFCIVLIQVVVSLLALGGIFPKQGILAHIGNLGHCFNIVYAVVALWPKRFFDTTIQAAIVSGFAVGLSIYANLDVEINALPFLTLGTPDLLDIPAGLLGTAIAIAVLPYLCTRKLGRGMPR